MNFGLAIKRVKWREYFAFESYNVKIGIRSNDAELIAECREMLDFIFPTGWREIEFAESKHLFSVYLPKSKNKTCYIYKNDELAVSQVRELFKFDLLEPQLRLTVAEFATDYVFIHAGAVAYKNKAIIIPGISFSGKTTLVAELSKRGLAYYSDEYAVIDRKGLLHPFSKKLSVRGIIDDYTQVEIAVEEMGGRKGFEPIPIGMILVTKYKKNARFKPEQISTGKGIIESLANSVSIRQSPEMVLQTLGLVTSRAKVIKTNRPQVEVFADKFLSYLEEINF
jgi:hypothetical protein